MDGRVRVSRGSDEVQTRHLQPSVGTPIEVPLPSIRMVAFIMAAFIMAAFIMVAFIVESIRLRVA